MYYEEIGDIKNASWRLGGYTTKKEMFRKFYGFLIITLIGVWLLSAIANHLIDRSIKSAQLKNLIVYGDESGFRPVK